MLKDKIVSREEKNRLKRLRHTNTSEFQKSVYDRLKENNIEGWMDNWTMDKEAYGDSFVLNGLYFAVTK